MSDRTLNLLTITTVVVTGIVLVSPDGPLHRQVVQWRDEVRLRKRLADMALALDSTGQGSGANDASRVVYEFSDYECPYCRTSETAIRSWIGDRRDVRRVYVHCPLPSHPSARTAAKVALCAEREGLASVIHDSIMGTLEWKNGSSWSALTARWGLRDTLELQRCLSDAAVETRLARGMALGDSLGVRGTPAFFTGRRTHLGVIDRAGLNALIE